MLERKKIGIELDVSVVDFDEQKARIIKDNLISGIYTRIGTLKTKGWIVGLEDYKIWHVAKVEPEDFTDPKTFPAPPVVIKVLESAGFDADEIQEITNAITKVVRRKLEEERENEPISKREWLWVTLFLLVCGFGIVWIIKTIIGAF